MVQIDLKWLNDWIICVSVKRFDLTAVHFLSSQDYMDIFDMSADSNDPKNLNICR